jgi:hypothetical protein
MQDLYRCCPEFIITYDFCFVANNIHSCPVDILWHYTTAAASYLPGPAEAPAKHEPGGSMFTGEAF